MENPLLLLLAAMLAAPQVHSKPGWTPPIRKEIPIRDEPCPGTIALDVDASRPAQVILNVRETIPVSAAGRLTLRYP